MDQQCFGKCDRILVYDLWGAKHNKCSHWYVTKVSHYDNYIELNKKLKAAWLKTTLKLLWACVQGIIPIS